MDDSTIIIVAWVILLATVGYWLWVIADTHRKVKDIYQWLHEYDGDESESGDQTD